MPQAGIDFSAFIADRTRDFTGREWVFAKIDAWLADPDAPRTFLLTGSPGSGKTAVAARLVQMSRDEVASNSFLRLGCDSLAYFHFCQANSDATLNPLRFIEALSRALANRYAAFREALLKTGDRDITINATQSVTTAAGAKTISVDPVKHVAYLFQPTYGPPPPDSKPEPSGRRARGPVTGAFLYVITH